MYILQINGASLVNIVEDKINLVSNISEATVFEIIGHAMRIAVEINAALGASLTRAVYYVSRPK